MQVTLNSMSPLRIRLLAPVAVLVLMLATASAVHAAAKPYTLLVYGDSLSAGYGIDEDDGWVNLLSRKLDSEGWPWEVINGSVSGETSTGGLARLPAMLESYQPDLVILELGGNDGLRGLPIDTLEQNLRSMIAQIRESGADVLLAGIQIPPNYGPRYTVPFFQLFGTLAEQENVPLIPFLIDGIPQQPQLMQDDGIHPRAEAQSMIVDNVWPHLQPMLNPE